MAAKKMTMGVIIGNRGFFPDHLAKMGREEMMQVLVKAGMDCVVLGPDESKYGAVETHDEAKRCAALFHKNRDRIDGVIVVSAPARVQRERVLRRKGMTGERLAAILKSQLPDCEKRRRADFIVRTALSRAAGARQIAGIVRLVRQGRWHRSARLRRLRGRVACGKS